ncbi:PHP domain-containing protein [Actinoplanes bogorensis]|uniref:Histidinol-phosphatase n=1 Tax=Paractinoplanes bogorensis TaxID=1610840 RepID=A0ABS5YY65_9ACTN|nr:PHP domain-containing protein [Actinoplanes bogorensis]MBU2668384.1 PHP domain-containing protein [Actinoplanes bogorensis]
MLETLPGDSHVHSEWSWDTSAGDMVGTCARAVEIGLPAVAFTEHLDFNHWITTPASLVTSPHQAPYTGDDLVVRPPRFDAAGYLAAIEECRGRFPGLRILSGLEIGEPHLNPDAVAELLKAGPFDRLLGSLHCLPVDDGHTGPPVLLETGKPDEVVRQYLAEVPVVVAASDAFEVFAHIDYPIRFWPADAAPFEPGDFEPEFRHALRCLADGGRTLEVNTRLPLHPQIVAWWREEGGRTVSFGSDAHLPAAVGGGFREAAHMVEAHGFRPGREAHDFWTR